jgi:2-iminobutanoate/2-iminopropanoate deaminase
MVALSRLVSKADETMQIITPNNIAAPGGHYSHAVVHNGIVYVSGQLPISPSGPLPNTASFEMQVETVLSNITAILVASDSAIEHVLRVTVYITDIALWPKFNTLYAAFFGAHRPARSVVPVPALHYGYLIEIDVIAATRTAHL